MARLKNLDLSSRAAGSKDETCGKSPWPAENITSFIAHIIEKIFDTILLGKSFSNKNLMHDNGEFVDTQKVFSFEHETLTKNVWYVLCIS